MVLLGVDVEQFPTDAVTTLLPVELYDIDLALGARDGKGVGLSQETHLRAFVLAFVLGEAPLRVEVAIEHFQKRQSALLVLGLLVLPLSDLLPERLQSEYVDSATVAAAGEPLLVLFKC